MQDKMGMPMDINVKLAQKYNPEKNFAHDINMRIWQKDLFNSNVETAIEGLDLEALTESLRGVLAQSGSDLKNNAGGLIFMYLALLGNTQVKNILVDVTMEKKLSELVKNYNAEHPQPGLMPEIQGFLNDPKSFKAVIQPVKGKTISALISDERSSYGVKGWVELLGAQMSFNNQPVDLVAMLQRDGLTAENEQPGNGELKIKRTIAE